MRTERVQGSVTSFFVGTFLVTWGLQLPAVWVKASGGRVDAYLPLAALGVLGPLVAATWVSARSGGRAGVRALYAPLLLWRVPLRWYVIALFGAGVALTGVLLALRSAGWSGPVLFLPTLGGVVVAAMISVGEEVGWRGYALPRLQQKYGPLGASGIIGFFWTLWHIPMFIGQGVPLSSLLVMFLLFLGASCFFTWIYNDTGGSLLLVVCAHMGAHLNNSHAALPGDVLPSVVHAVVYGALGYAVLSPSVRRGRAERLDGKSLCVGTR